MRKVDKGSESWPTRRRKSRCTRSDTLRSEFLEKRQEGTVRSRDEMSRAYETESLASRLHYNTWRGATTTTRDSRPLSSTFVRRGSDSIAFAAT